jgi:hypothetical protein
MSRLLFIFLMLLPVQERSGYPLKDGRPTSKGIDSYVEDKAEELISLFQDFVQDTLYNANVYTEDLSGNKDLNPLELGNYYPNEIFINNKGEFFAYELEELNRESLDTIFSTNKFVKAAILHELMHHYIYQLSIEMLRVDRVHVDRAYQSFFRIYSQRDDLGSRFIEEGICEYASLRMKAIISRGRPYRPKKISDLSRVDKAYDIFYRYSAYNLSEFLDTTGLKLGIKTLLHNPPPSDVEILDPKLFFARLKSIDALPASN